jgi:uncharacterized phage infection (PIP) family protein YhgE
MTSEAVNVGLSDPKNETMVLQEKVTALEAALKELIEAATVVDKSHQQLLPLLAVQTKIAKCLAGSLAVAKTYVDGLQADLQEAARAADAQKREHTELKESLKKAVTTTSIVAGPPILLPSVFVDRIRDNEPDDQTTFVARQRNLLYHHAQDLIEVMKVLRPCLSASITQRLDRLHFTVLLVEEHVEEGEAAARKDVEDTAGKEILEGIENMVLGADDDM